MRQFVNNFSEEERKNFREIDVTFTAVKGHIVKKDSEKMGMYCSWNRYKTMYTKPFFYNHFDNPEQAAREFVESLRGKLTKPYEVEICVSDSRFKLETLYKTTI